MWTLLQSWGNGSISGYLRHMKIPVIHGFIDRRILVNFTVSPDAVQPLLPPPCRPKLFNGKAIAGVCLIRLREIKPKGFPAFMGLSSENGAHRIAVEWEENGETKEGVYIPRRDTSSRWNAWAGGRFFPGKHHLAQFEVQERGDDYHVAFNSSDHTHISITARISTSFPASSVFSSLHEASDFFEKGTNGYSPNGRQQLDGLCLQVYHWKVLPLQVFQVTSSFFENRSFFSANEVRFDHALLMKNTEHEWRSL